MTHRACLFSIGGLLVATFGLAHAKDCPTYYTPERIAIGRQNVAEHEWAQDLLELMLDRGQPQTYIIGRDYVAARQYAAQDDEFIWLLQPTTLLPRVGTHEAYAECPIHGTDVRKINAYHPWRIDPINHPYKIQCALGGEWYPSNNYHKGDMTSGDFPDDGNGILLDGRRFFMLREYAHNCYCSVTIPALRTLSQAWLLTGDELYAHKGAVLLTRLASEYPNHEDRKDRLYLAPYGGTHPHYTWKHGGMITDLIWETFCTEAAVLAYDALYDYLGQDPELIEFAQAKGLPIEDAEDLRRYIERYILRAAATGLLNGAIRGNDGHHQALAMTIALVLDDYSDTHPNSLDMVDYAFHGEGRAAYIFANGLYRDGGGHESPNYNAIKLDFTRVARLMEQVRERRPDLFPPEKYPDIFAEPKAASVFDWFISIQVMNRFLPSIGDCAGRLTPTRTPERAYSLLTSQNIFAFDKYREPRYARACTRADSGQMYHGELFWPYPAREIQEALDDPRSEIVRHPRLLDDYGVAILESGEGESTRAVVLNYSATPGHRQADNLNLELFWRGLDLLPDLGYPFTWDYTGPWDASIMAHNTVSVGETPGDTRVRLGNECSLFSSENGVHVVTARHNPYPQGYGLGREAAPAVDLYERTVVMVDIDPERFYVVDLFAVNGGEQRDQSWHGPLIAPIAPELDWVAQEGGTLAGPEVEQFANYTDKWGRKRTNFPCFLKDIRRAPLEQPARWTWDYGLPEGDRLDLHLLPVGGPMEVIMGNGRSPARPKDWALDYLIARRQAPLEDRTLFLTVLAPYVGEPVVQSVRLVSESPLAVEIARANGTDVVTLGTPPGPSRTTAHRPGGVRVQSYSGEELTRQVEVGNWAQAEGPGFAQTGVSAVDYDARAIAIPYTEGCEHDFSPGRTLRIYNEKRTGMFRILAARREGDLLHLDLDLTALLARGPVTAVEDGAVTVGSHFTLATGHADDGGQLVETDHLYFAGSRLGEGETQRTVKGAVRLSASATKVYFADPVPATELQRDYAGKTLSVWQYGTGDRVEVARVRTAGAR